MTLQPLASTTILLSAALLSLTVLYNQVAGLSSTPTLACQGHISPSIPDWQSRVASVEVRVFARLPCEVVVLPVLLLKHVVIEPGIQNDSYVTQ